MKTVRLFLPKMVAFDLRDPAAPRACYSERYSGASNYCSIELQVDESVLQVLNNPTKWPGQYSKAIEYLATKAMQTMQTRNQVNISAVRKVSGAGDPTNLITLGYAQRSGVAAFVIAGTGAVGPAGLVDTSSEYYAGPVGYFAQFRLAQDVTPFSGSLLFQDQGTSTTPVDPVLIEVLGMPVDAYIGALHSDTSPGIHEIQVRSMHIVTSGVPATTVTLDNGAYCRFEVVNDSAVAFEPKSLNAMQARSTGSASFRQHVEKTLRAGLFGWSPDGLVNASQNVMT